MLSIWNDGKGPFHCRKGSCYFSTRRIIFRQCARDRGFLVSAILRDSGVSEIVSMGREANIAVFGIGKTSYQSVLNLAGYFKEGEYDKLLAAGAVGDICSRFFTVSGTICDDALNERTIGIHLADLQKKEHSIAIACGEEKALAVLGALQGNYVNTLFTDELTARELIKQHDISKHQGA